MLPLSGLRVIEMGGLLPSAFCALVLADFGADVVRIDRFGSPYFEGMKVMGRGKKSMILDLKHPKGVETLLKMVEKADVLLDPFRPGIMEKLGVGPDVALEKNPRLIYARLSGFGQNGPWATWGGHDLNFIALSGIFQRICSPYDDLTRLKSVALGDLGGGSIMCALGIMFALFERSRSGRGQVIDASIVEGLNYLTTFLRVRKPINLLDQDCPFYRLYRTMDDKLMAAASLEPHFYEQLVKGLGLENHDLPGREDPSQWKTLTEKFQAVFLTKTREEWTSIFNENIACVTPVLDENDLLNQPHYQERNSFVASETGNAIPTPAPHLVRTPGEIRKGAAKLGENTQEVLRDYGFDQSRIDQLFNIHVIE